MQIILAKTAGFCFGVKRAVELVYSMVDKENKKMYTFGPIIHNEHVVEDLRSKGVYPIDSIEEIKGNNPKLIIRTHGISKEIYNSLEENKVDYVDATCPYVKKIHQIVKESSDAGYQIIIVGNPLHPEIKGINGWCNNSALIIDNISDVEDIKETIIKSKAISIVAQTTFNRETWQEIINSIKQIRVDIKVYDTICSATNARQKEAQEIAKQVDIMIVIGGKNSSNTQKLAQICKKYCKDTYHIQTFKDLPKKLNHLNKKVGITAGASTPAWIIKEVINKMTQEEKLREEVNLENDVVLEESMDSEIIQTCPDEEPQATSEEGNKKDDLSENNEEAFAQAIEDSLVTLRTGETVKGTVIKITDNEVFVDLKYKSDGIIALSELTNDPDLTAHDVVKVNDEIEVFVIRVDDGEGNVLLSKKKLDIIKAWEKLEEAFKNKTNVQGKVIEVVNGGVVVLASGIRVFIPASQVSNRYVPNFRTMVGETASFILIDFNQKRRKVVGSIKEVLKADFEIKEKEFWENIEVGKYYNGEVKRLTSFGAFVDLGVVDGLVHVSELSWSRIGHPSEVLKEGDMAEVYVIDFDKEKNRISLGFKKAEDNPWEVARRTFEVGDIVKCKVVRLVPFGAFVELIPEVDGLIHISQIANERIDKPSSVLSIGQEVEAKIIEKDIDNQRISLSIRELIKEKEVQDEALNIQENEEKDESNEEDKVTIGDIFNEKEKENGNEILIEDENNNLLENADEELNEDIEEYINVKDLSLDEDVNDEE